MSSLAQLVSVTGLAGRVFNERQLSELLGRSDARRYGLVNRALKDGSPIRVKRGTQKLQQIRIVTFLYHASARIFSPCSNSSDPSPS
jgi:hypothetical protein